MYHWENFGQFEEMKKLREQKENETYLSGHQFGSETTGNQHKNNKGKNKKNYFK